MSFTIYGLRLIGSAEARYIGQTNQDPAGRLANLLYLARYAPTKRPFALWLLQNAPSVEVFEIARAPTRDEARRIERETVRVCLALNHRIYNQWLVPSERRVSHERLQGLAA